MKTLKMFGLCLAFITLLVAGVLVNFASASDIQTDLTDHTYTVNIDGSNYDLYFRQGPFGPGPSGTATLMQNDAVLNKYDFNSRGDLINIIGLGNFFYGNYQIVYIPGASVLLLNCSDCLTQ